MHLGATELFHSVTPTGSGYIYPRAKIWKFLRTLSPALSLLCLPGSPDRPPRCQPPPVAGLRRRQRDRLRHCRRSKSIAELGYGFENFVLSSLQFLAHCVAMYLATIENFLSNENTPLISFGLKI